ncbi:methionine aminopeptidase [Sporobolomyces salmoneus]|uniref:methionine aminopeptidase n=1 Tax=Sporobolomyces salmoneus TaxID=183962 RepID=UPI00316B96CB
MSATTAEAVVPPTQELSSVKLDQTAEEAKKDSPAAEEGEDEDGEEENGGDATTGTDKKKKKKKPKKKKKATNGAAGVVEGPLIPQTEPPTVPVSKQYKNGQYPVGECHDYINDNAYRTTSEELRALERQLLSEGPDSPNNYNAIRRAAEVHRQVRQYARKSIKPGMTMTEIVELIENGTRALVEENGMKSGIGFPTGVNRNHCAAHFSPNAGDKTVLLYEDTLKVDFGVHVNGRIVDSAFTLNFEPTYDNLLLACREATETGVREAGIDVRMGDIGAAIQETMESYEVEVNGKTLPVKSIRNLTGHSIEPYTIHAGKSVPIVKMNEDDEEYDVKMEEGEYFAIETFGTTGSGRVRDEGVCSHYARMPSNSKVPLRSASAKRLLGVIDRNFGTLPWCRRYLDRIGETAYLIGLKELVETGLVQDYPPLCDIEGSQTAQSEHTILLRPTCKEIVSRGDDY